AAQAEGKTVFHVIAQIDPLCAMPIAARQLVANGLAAVASILGARPEPGAAGQAKNIDLLISTSASQEQIVAKSLIPTVIAKVECYVMSASAATLEDSVAESLVDGAGPSSNSNETHELVPAEPETAPKPTTTQ